MLKEKKFFVEDFEIDSLKLRRARVVVDGKVGKMAACRSGGLGSITGPGQT
jgi:hypothetical protein